MKIGLKKILSAIICTLITLGCSNLNATVVTDGLVSWWKFDETSGTTAADSVGSNDGTLVNFDAATAWTNDTPGAASSGAFYFDGVDDIVNCGSSFSSVSNAMTAELWIKRRAITGSFDSFLSKYQNNDYRWYLRMIDSGKMIAYGRTGGTSIFGGDLNSTEYIYSNVWHHIVLTTSADSNCCWYVDGLLAGSQTMGTASLVNSGNLLIGSYINAVNAPIGALIDDVRIYNRALTAEEVLQNYRAINDNCGLVTDNLLSWWKLDEGFGSRTHDAWAGGYCYLSNFDTASAWTNDTPGGISACALKFDGIDDAINTGNALPSITNAMTAELWIKHWPISDGDPWQALLTKYQTSTNRWYLRYSPSSILVAYGQSDGANIFEGTDFNSTKAVSYDVWHHIVLTVAADSNCCWYVDSELAGTGSVLNPLNNTANLYIGSYYGLGWRTIDAVIDEVRIYDRALTAKEVKQNYRVTVPGPPAGTVIVVF